MPVMEKIGRRLYQAGNIVIGVTGCIIFLFLSWYSFRFTQYMPAYAPEIPVNVKDSMAQNIVMLILFLFLFWGLTVLEGRLAEKVRKRIITWAVLLMVLWIAFASIWWICSEVRVLGSDPLCICNDAVSFSKGIYYSLDTGFYCDKYPQQLGLIAFMELVFLAAGPGNFFAFEFISALLAPCIAYLGYRITAQITDSMAVKVCYCLTMSACIPLVFYTSWVYGEVPSMFFCLLAVALILHYEHKKHWGYLLGTVLSLAMAMLLRRNSVILMIALCVTAFLWALRYKDRKMLVTAFCVMAVPYLAFAGIQQMYEIRSGIEKSEGLPRTAGISLGLQEVEGRYGWDYGYEGNVYWWNDSDKEKADAVYRQDIEDRLEEFKENPSYAVHFFKEKLLSQWNAPLYQSYYFNHNYKEIPDESSWLYRLGTDYFTVLLRICDRLQFILYVGMFLYFLCAAGRESNMLQHALPVMIIGGFFLSLIWEAKTRYILPYYIAMFPMAVLGYRQFLLKLLAFWQSRGYNGNSVSKTNDRG